MLGAIIGDVVGSVYEGRHRTIKTTVFPLFSDKSRFTDDTVMTLAIADALMEVYQERDGKWHDEDAEKLETAAIKCMQKLGHDFPYAGYGGGFRKWLCAENPRPYRSYGNGAPMRVSPIAWAFDTLEDVEKGAETVTCVTHNHPEGIKGAKAVAVAGFLARKGESRDNIKNFIEQHYGYNLELSLNEIRPTYHFDTSSQGTVPEAITAFLEAESFEDAIRLAVSLGGDSDTLAAITGGIAEGAWDIPKEIDNQVFKRLDPRLRNILTRWNKWCKLEKG